MCIPNGSVLLMNQIKIIFPYLFICFISPSALFGYDNEASEYNEAEKYNREHSLLYTFSDEVLQNILYHLQDNNDLANVRLTSKWFNRNANFLIALKNKQTYYNMYTNIKFPETSFYMEEKEAPDISSSFPEDATKKLITTLNFIKSCGFKNIHLHWHPSQPEEKIIDTLSQHDSLERLIISPIDNAILEALGKHLPHWKHLKDIKISCLENYPFHSSIMMNLIKQLPENIEELQLAHMNFKHIPIAPLVNFLKQSKTLKALYLGSNKICDPNTNDIVFNLPSTLKILDLSHLKISLQTFKNLIKKFPSLKELEYLDLSGNVFASGELFENLINLPKLSTLKLNFIKEGETGTSLLIEKLFHFPNLKLVELCGNNISKELRDKLQILSEEKNIIFFTQSDPKKLTDSLEKFRLPRIRNDRALNNWVNWEDPSNEPEESLEDDTYVDSPRPPQPVAEPNEPFIIKLLKWGKKKITRKKD